MSVLVCRLDVSGFVTADSAVPGRCPLGSIGVGLLAGVRRQVMRGKRLATRGHAAGWGWGC